MISTRGILPFAVGAIALLLSACGGETPGTAVAGSTAEERTTPAASTTAQPAPAPSGDATAPGTQLSFGQRAVVPFTFGSEKKGTLGITVTAIDRGENADLAKFGDKAKGMTPFYIRVTVENVGGTDLSYSSVRLRGLGPDGRSTGVIITGETDKCQSESAKRDFTTPGAKYETCVLQAAREGSSVAAASFDQSDAYAKSPVIWKG
ncbi:hypothetical protein [Allokutzneria oryzae]|uniref:DUF4352 domain-containing protein n=1 Tax=Allokutzneria oryzae TaxID=1378989 RepID=A0ABV5ZPT5_9PSEU